MNPNTTADMSPIPPEALKAMSAPRDPDTPRRCFICLTDEESSDPPGSWVDPCPCTLEAHQDCILSWVTDCERSNRPLKCPVCKSTIELEGSWDPIVGISDQIQKRFSRLSPFLLFTGVSMGVQASMQIYGAMALWTFSGKDVMMHYLLGPDLAIDANGANTLQFVRERITSALVMTNVAPALVLGRLLPGFSNRIFLPTASLYGLFHVIHDEQFMTWPPSPQLAIAMFPYLRSVYYNIWKDFVLPYEVRLNRQLLGLPAEEPPRENAEARNNERRQLEQVENREQGLIEMLQTLVEALGGEEDDELGQWQQVPADEAERDQNQRQDGDQEVMVELVIGEMPEEEENIPPAVAGRDNVNGNGDQLAQPNGEPGAGQADGEAQNHEVPQAPARRIGLGNLLSNVSNAIVSALILPGLSFAAGETLRLILPEAWTAPATRSSWSRIRPGLLQQQWGRSLVGGCLYVVLRDLLRVYAKTRKVSSMANRRVKNVDRPRRKTE